MRKLTAGAGADVMEVIHDWAAMIAFDGVLDRGYTLAGGQAARYRTATLSGGVDWRNPQAYAKSGAPPNGSDYLRFRKKSGAFFKAGEIRSIAFDGSQAFPGAPRSSGRSTRPARARGNAALHSGGGGGLDRGIVRQVKVPPAPRRSPSRPATTSPPVSTSRSSRSRRTAAARGAASRVADERQGEPERPSLARRNLPGLTGRSGQGPFPTWVRATYDLAAYRGRTVLLAFRYVSDPRVTFPGWWIDDVRLGGATLTAGRSLAGWRSFSRVTPGERVGGFTVQLVGYTTSAKRACDPAVAPRRTAPGSASRAPLRRFLSGGYDVVAAIVTFDEPDRGALTEYAPYVLRGVNGMTVSSRRLGLASRRLPPPRRTLKVFAFGSAFRQIYWTELSDV